MWNFPDCLLSPFGTTCSFFLLPPCYVAFSAKAEAHQTCDCPPQYVCAGDVTVTAEGLPWGPLRSSSSASLQIISHDTRRFRFALPSPQHILGLPIGESAQPSSSPPWSPVGEGACVPDSGTSVGFKTSAEACWESL